MDFIWDSFGTALQLIARWDTEVFDTVKTSLLTSVCSTLLASLVGVALALIVGTRSFTGKRVVVALLNTLLALPTVVIGLVLYAFLSRRGPLGQWEFLFTPAALVMGQTVLAVPIVTSYALSALSTADSRLIPSTLTLGLGQAQTATLILAELRFGMMAAIIAGFGRVISEVGAAMILGGNIRGYTRTMTTAIALETSSGDFGRSLALGLILLGVALLTNLFLNFFQQRQT